MKAGLKIYREGKGPRLILLHGWGMNSAIFDPLVPRLRDDYEVLRVDLPGHGGSEWLANESFDGQVERIAEQLPEGILLGWSMGGLYASSLARRYPGKFKQLILVSTNPLFVKRDDWTCAVDQQLFDDFSRDLIADWSATIKRFMGLQMHGADNARTLMREITRLLVQGGRPQQEALEAGLRLLLNYDARDELSAISQPLLFVLGQRDTLVPAALAQQLVQINPRFRVECLAFSAHVPFLSHSESFTDLLSEFIKSTSAG